MDFVAPGSLLVKTAEGSFSSYRCSFLFGAGGVLAGAGLESNLGNDVILNSSAFIQSEPRDWGGAAALDKGGSPSSG